MLAFPRAIIRIIIIVKWIPHSLSWSSQTVFEADQLYRTLESVSFHRLRRPQPKPIAVAPPTNGHSPLGANVRVGHTSFIHGDGRHFASSRAISESIKKAINFERTERKKNVGAINHRGRLPDADKSLTYWQHLSALYPKGPESSATKPISSHGCS